MQMSRDSSGMQPVSQKVQELDSHLIQVLIEIKNNFTADYKRSVHFMVN